MISTEPCNAAQGKTLRVVVFVCFQKLSGALITEIIIKPSFVAKWEKQENVFDSFATKIVEAFFSYRRGQDASNATNPHRDFFNILKPW